MTRLAVGRRWFRSAALLALMLQSAPPAFAGQDPTVRAPSPSAPAPPQDPEVENTSVPVVLGGDPIIWITTGTGPYTPQFRAERISQRLE